MTLPARVLEWLAARTGRERRLLAAAAAVSVTLGLLAVVQAARDDLATLRARVAGHERELVEVRRLAAALRREAPRPVAAADAPLLGRLEAAAAATVGRERIASMTPAAPPADGAPDTVAVRVAGASLAEVVRLLHGLATGDPPLPVTRLELRKRPDDAQRFEAVVEVAR